MAKYQLDIGDGSYEVDAPNDATPDQLKQIAQNILTQQRADMSVAPPQEASTTTTPATTPEDTTITTTSDTPIPPRAGMLPTVIRAGGGIAAPLIASAMAAGSGGTLTVPGVAAGGAVASLSETLAQELEKNSYEGQFDPEGRKKLSPARIAMEAPLAFIPIGSARGMLKAVKEGAKAGALTTAGISAADYFDTGKLPSLKEAGTNLFLTTVLGALGSRLAGFLEPEMPGISSTLQRTEDITTNVDVPKERMPEIDEIEKATKTANRTPTTLDRMKIKNETTKRTNVAKAKAKGKIITPDEEFDFSSSRRERNQMPEDSAVEGPDIHEESHVLNPTDKVREDLAAEGLSVRNPNVANQQLIDHVQTDLNVPEAKRIKPKASYGEVDDYLTRLSQGEVKSSPLGLRGNLGMRPTSNVVQDLSSATNIPAYDDYAWLERQVEQKRQFEDLWAGSGDADQPGLTKIFRGTSRKTQEQMTEWLEAKDKMSIEQKYGWNGRTIEKAQQLRSFYDRFFKIFGVDADKFLEEYAPHYRKRIEAGVDIGADDPRVPKEALPFFKHDRYGTVDVYERNALKAAARYLRAGTFEKFMGPRWNQLQDTYYGLYKDPTNDLLKQRLGKEMLQVMETIKGPKSDALFVGIQDMLNGMSKRLGIPLEVDPHVIVDNLLSVQNLAYLGGNIPSLVRDAFQPVLTAYPKLGPRYFAKGLKLATTQMGRERAAGAGITRGMTVGMHDALTLTKGPFSRGVGALTKAGMYPRQMNESFGRSAVYNGMVAKAEDALKVAMKVKGSEFDKLRRFIDLADIDRFHPEVQKDVAAHFLLKQPEEAIDVAARALVNETMFDYTAMGRPKAIRNTAGKLGLTYGVWPMSYTEFMTNFNNFGQPWKIKRDRARLLLAHGAVVGAFGGLGVLAGDENAFRDSLKQAFWGPTVPGISGLADIGLSGLAALHGAPGAVGELKYKAKGLIPGSAAKRNLDDILQEQSGFRKVGRLLGFVRGHQKEDYAGIKPMTGVRKIKPAETEESSLFRELFHGPFGGKR